MKRYIPVFGFIALSACASAQPPVERPADWNESLTLAWSDEFNEDGLPDPTLWTYDTHRNADGWYNEEAQYYADARLENSRVKNGVLILTARKERLDDKADYGGQDYSSARLHTKGLKTMRYGRAEARIKVPCGRGLWPAFWMLPENGGGWPEGGEIDIMEYVGHTPDSFYANVHTADHNHAEGTDLAEEYPAPSACEGWYVHRLDWTPELITISIDGNPYFSYDRGDGSQGRWPFDEDFHFLLNIAVGGSWGGQEGIDDSVFPAEMKVDYVRVYEWADD